MDTVDCGDVAALWISDVLEKPGCRLVRLPPAKSRLWPFELEVRRVPVFQISIYAGLGSFSLV